MNKKTICSLALLLAMLLALATSPQVQAAPNTDFVQLYKQFFTDMNNKKYTEAWDSQSRGSKMVICEEIAKAANADKTAVTAEAVLGMMDRNDNNVRTIFFDNFVEKVPMKDMLAAKYALKSSTATEAIITITLEGDPGDFKMLMEGGRWKINFFEDLMSK